MRPTARAQRHLRLPGLSRCLIRAGRSHSHRPRIPHLTTPRPPAPLLQSRPDRTHLPVALLARRRAEYILGSEESLVSARAAAKAPRAALAARMTRARRPVLLRTPKLSRSRSCKLGGRDEITRSPLHRDRGGRRRPNTQHSSGVTVIKPPTCNASPGHDRAWRVDAAESHRGHDRAELAALATVDQTVALRYLSHCGYRRAPRTSSSAVNPRAAPARGSAGAGAGVRSCWPVPAALRRGAKSTIRPRSAAAHS